MTHEQLESNYRDALKTLRDLAALREYTPGGDKAFHAQRENVYWAKCALVLWEGKNNG
jgi:hypothetical protein